MSKKSYRGSCVCKRVTFEADVDLMEVGTGKCNCTSCFKRRWWSVRVDPASFRALSGEDQLSKGGFCPDCGVRPFARVPVTEWNPTAYVSTNVACLDADPAELIAAPVTYYDGLHDNWWNPPAETRHL
jgi:hypothetical protein